jgi:hypothetical protein
MQQFTLKPQSDVVVPHCLAKNVQDKDFVRLLEAQRVEQLLIEAIISANSIILGQYYSQLLMAHRLQRAELEVELYGQAIAEDGLCLLSGAFNSVVNTLQYL